MSESSQTGPVAVYGATGYTGRLVAAELGRRGADFVLSGRDHRKLRELSGSLGGAPFVAVGLDETGGLRKLLEPCAAVIACAGPFVRHGEPVLAAAAETGTHYLDTTGEQVFMRRVFDCYGEAARSSGACLVTAMGFDYVPGDMIASLTAQGMGPLEEVVLAYSVHGMRATRGTTLSAIGMISGGDLAYTDGALRPAPQGVDRGSFDFGPPVGVRRMVRYPAGEPVTVPLHVPTRNVSTMLSAGTVAPSWMAPALPVAVPVFAAAMRTPLRRAAESLVDRLPEGPEPSRRRAARWVVACEARARGARRRGTVRGSDVYGLTAATTVEGALRMATPGFGQSGALAPSQAFEPADFLASLNSPGVEVEVEPLSAPAVS